MLILLLYVLVFVVLSGLMAMVEAAILSISQAEVEELVQQKRRGAESLDTVINRLPRALVVIVLITNTINILGPILAGNKAIELYGDSVIALITAILTLSTIIFSEIIPKSIGSHYAPSIACVVSPAIVIGVYVAYPLVVGLEWVVKLFTTGERKIGTEAQIRSLVTIGRRAGHIESGEGQLIQRAFILNDRTAADIMTPAADVVSLSDQQTIREASLRVFRTEYSRYPVFAATADEVRGMVLSRDILEALTDGLDDAPVQQIMRPPLTVTSRTRVDRLLALFRDVRIHLAIVRDQHKTIGVVTLEDVLEELVGEIEDEKDVAK